MSLLPLFLAIEPSDADYLRAVYAVLGAVVVILGLIWWNRHLHRRVERHTKSLRESEARFRAVLEKVGLVAVILDREGRVTLCSDYLLNLTGWTRSEVIGCNWFEMFLPEEIRGQINTQVYQQLLRELRIGVTYENEIKTRDGRRRLIAWSNTTIKDLSGQVAGVASLGVDVTEHRHAELRAQYLANFPELNPNPVLAFSASGELSYRNPAATEMARLVGYDKVESLLPPETCEIVRQSLETGQPRLRLLSQHGSHHLSWSFYPIKEQAVVHCYAGDVTERHLMEDRLRQKQKLEAIGQLAGGVAHDFNNLLTVIIGHIDLLKTDVGLRPDLTESMTEIAEAANRGANLTRQLLTFSRQQVMTPRDLDLNQVIMHVHKMLSRVIGDHVSIHLALSSEVQPFRGDTSMIEQVLLNLAVNARDAMPGGGTLMIKTERVSGFSTKDGGFHHGEFIKMAVADTGTGISPEVLPRIFDPFFTTKEVGKGTGLGLATVVGVMQQHGGFVEVESAIGRGTIFYIYLRRTSAQSTVLMHDHPKIHTQGRGETILFVEDEPSVRAIGVAALQRRGYRVLAAENGPEAVSIWAQHKGAILLLVTDIMMPGGMNGVELAKRLLAEKPELQVIYSSGYTTEIAGENLIIKEGVNYLGKPYGIDELFEAVRMALDTEVSRPPF